MPIHLAKESTHPEALSFDLQETLLGPFDLLTVYSPSESAVNTCVDILTPKFSLLAKVPSELSEPGVYERIAGVPKKQTSLLKAYLYNAFNQAAGGTAN